MNIGRSEYTRLVRIETKFNKIIELVRWKDECLEVLATADPDDERSPVFYEAIRVLDEACTELEHHLKEIAL